ncbi:hypothetical protein HIM_02828 [Hirsutella minnesotensis 3608]|nr:hypothetical protein HIM_02828 [Hirsutella minnesotensis 3608]
MEHIRVAIIGLGPAGLTALKSLREEGFDAVAFERRSEIGGVWAYSTNTTFTSVTRETVSNISKFVSGFSDFPIPKGYPPYLSGAQVAEYFQSYAKNFDLERHIHFDTTVWRVVRDESRQAWRVHITGPNGDSELCFDKVVFGTGSEDIPKWPPMPGRHRFRGVVLHGQSYRSPDAFAGKRVMVVGIGNTACEISISLSRHASKLYQAYRRGRLIVSRYLDNGIPTDSTISWPMLRLKYLMDHRVPWLVNPFVDELMARKMVHDTARDDIAPPDISERGNRRRVRRKIKSDWGLSPRPSMAHEHPAVQEDFMPLLSSGVVTPLRGFKDFIGPSQVLLDDNTVVEVDAVIFCTGYAHNFGLMPELEMNGACGIPLTTFGRHIGEQTENGQINHEPSATVNKPPALPRLYHSIFPPRHASSVAFLSWMAPQESVWSVCELASMAVAQIWSAESSRGIGLKLPSAGYRKASFLPSLEVMEAEVDHYHAWWRRQWAREHSIRPGLVRSHTFYRFLHDMAGTGLYDNLDHPLTMCGWKLWWRDRGLYRCLAQGPMNSYSWRIFDTNPQQIPGHGRQTWDGARDATKDADCG